MEELLFEPAVKKGSAVVAAVVVSRKQLTSKAEQIMTAPLGGAGNWKSNCTPRYVLTKVSEENGCFTVSTVTP